MNRLRVAHDIKAFLFNVFFGATLMIILVEVTKLIVSSSFSIIRFSNIPELIVWPVCLIGLAWGVLVIRMVAIYGAGLSYFLCFYGENGVGMEEVVK